MKTLFIIFSISIVIMFGAAIIKGDPSAKSFVNHIHDRATYKAPIINVNNTIQTEVIVYSI